MQASPRRISAQIRVSAARIYATEQLDPDETRAEVAARLALRQFQRSAGSVANADVVSCHLVFVSDDAQLEAVVVNIEARQARLAAAASGYSGVPTRRSAPARAGTATAGTPTPHTATSPPSAPTPDTLPANRCSVWTWKREVLRGRGVRREKAVRHESRGEGRQRQTARAPPVPRLPLLVVQVVAPRPPAPRRRSRERAPAPPRRNRPRGGAPAPPRQPGN